MLLDYKRTITQRYPKRFAAAAGVVAFVFTLLTALCLVHAVEYLEGAEQASKTFCGTCYHTMMDSLGLPLEKTLPLAFFFGGCALVSFVQAIRFLNGSKVAEAAVA